MIWVRRIQMSTQRDQKMKREREIYSSATTHKHTNIVCLARNAKDDDEEKRQQLLWSDVQCTYIHTERHSRVIGSKAKETVLVFSNGQQKSGS